MRSAARRAGFPAWLLSCSIHVVGIVSIGLLLQPPPKGNQTEADRRGGIVLVRESVNRTSYLDEADSAHSGAAMAATSNASDITSAALAATLPAADRPPVDLSGALPDPADVAASSANLDALPAAGDWAAGNLAEGEGGSSRGSRNSWSDYATQTKVFGIEGKGSRFVYVFDRSGSMSGFEGRPLAAAKAELLTSLQDLGSTHQFQIIFYNNRPSVFNPHFPQSARMLFGDDQNKRLAERFVRGIVGDGGTRHKEALRLALQMTPDVIFFLTDAAHPGMTAGELNEVQRLNRRVGASIHAIEFGAGAYRGRASFLVKLARQNNGQHTYVDLTRLAGTR